MKIQLAIAMALTAVAAPRQLLAQDLPLIPSTQPVQPVTRTSVQPVTVQPVQPVATNATQPVQPVASTPVQPVTTQPAQPAATNPTQPVTRQPVRPVASTPVQPVTTQPAQPAATNPTQPDATQPVVTNPPQPTKPPLSDFGLTETRLSTITASELKNLEPNVFSAMKKEEVAVLPPTALQAMQPEQMAKLDRDATQGFNPQQLQNLPATAFSGLTQEGLAGMPPATLEKIQPEQVQQLSTQALAGMKPEQLNALPPETVGEFKPEQVAAMPKTALAGMTGEQFKELPQNTLSTLPTETIGGLPPAVIQTFTNQELQQLAPKNLPGQDMMKVLNNLDTSKVDEATVKNLLPADWELRPSDKNPTAYQLIPPPETPLSFRPLPQPTNAQIKMPELPDLKNCGAFLGCTAPTQDSTALAGMNATLDQAGLPGGFSIQQEDNGSLKVYGSGVAAGVQLAFMPLVEGIKQAPKDAKPGLVAQDNGQVTVITSAGQQIPVVPAWSDPKQVLTVLDSMGNSGTQGQGQARVEIGNYCETLLIYPTNSRRSGAREVVMPDPAIEDAPTDWNSGISRRAESASQRFVYSDGTMQKIYPTVLEPEVFIKLAQAYVDVKSVEFHLNGYFIVTLDNGIRLRLTPDAEVASSNETTAKLEVTLKGVRYHLPHNGETYLFLLQVSVEV